MRIGLAYPPTLPPSLLPEVAAQLDRGRIDELWLIEDCFSTTGPSLAAAALTATERMEVGIGILPAVVRHPAMTAMELATLADLGGGRFTAGIGHAFRTLPYFEDLRDRFVDGGAEALAGMPVDWWRDLGPIGSPEDANEYFDRAEAAGADSVSVFPAYEVEPALRDIRSLVEFARERR